MPFMGLNKRLVSWSSSCVGFNKRVSNRVWVIRILTWTFKFNPTNWMPSQHWSSTLYWTIIRNCTKPPNGYHGGSLMLLTAIHNYPDWIYTHGHEKSSTQFLIYTHLLLTFFLKNQIITSSLLKPINSLRFWEPAVLWFWFFRTHTPGISLIFFTYPHWRFFNFVGSYKGV